MGSLVLSLLVVVFVLLLNALFVVAEFALVASRHSRIKELADEGSAAAKTVQQLQKDIGTSVSGTQLGITLCSLALGWIGENALNELVALIVSAIPGGGVVTLPHGFGMVVAFLLLSGSHVVLGEQVPKFIALRMPERVILALAPIFRVYCFLAWPLIWTMNRCAELILKLLGIPKTAEEDKFVHSAEELEMLFEASHKAGELGERETDILKKVLDWRNLSVGEVLVPVGKMDAVSVGLSLAQLLSIVAKTKHSKLPVFKDSVDNVVGVLNTRDLFDWWSNSLASAAGNSEKWKQHVHDFNIAKFLRAAYTIENTHKASTLLDDLRKRKIQIAIVKEAGGKTVGLVTMEDLLEELVGEIYDEYDRP